MALDLIIKLASWWIYKLTSLVQALSSFNVLFYNLHKIYSNLYCRIGIETIM